MAEHYRAVVIGAGRGGQGRAGVHSIGYLHGETYRQSGRVKIVAAADLVPENAATYAEEFGLERTYDDYRTMLAAEKPDLVSVCTWPPLHAEMVIAAAEAGAKGIYCEKPMALSMGDVDRMIAACEANGAKLVINHQRRFLPVFVEARRLIDSGKIGEVTTINAGIEGWDILSWGTHWIDMYRFLMGDRQAQWVVAGVDARQGQVKYGHHVEDHTLTCFGFEGGAHAFLETGRATQHAPTMRIAGTDGLIDIVEGEAAARGPIRYMSANTQGWVYPAIEGGVHDFTIGTGRLLAGLLDWIEGGPESTVSAANSRKTTELIMASYESARTGTIIDLPLQASDFPLETIVERQSGAVTAG